MASLEDGYPCVILDNGSYQIKSGFAGEDAPRYIFRTIVGSHFYEGNGFLGGDHCYIGNKAIDMTDVLDVRTPIERGVVTDWDAMGQIWTHVLNDHLIKPSEGFILVTESAMNSKSNKEKMIQVMFEKFHPRGMNVISPNVLSIYSPGRLNGLVVDSGYETTIVGCIYEGFLIPQSIFRSDIGGNDITHYLIELLSKQGYSFTTTKEIEEANRMKEQCAFVSNNPEAEKYHIKTDYTCSGGTVVSLGYETFQCMEAMFNPTLINSDAPGIHKLIINSINACPRDVIRDFYCNIILAGGNTMAIGLVARLKQELQAMLPIESRIKIVAPPERRYSTWIGGSIIGRISAAQTMWITAADYDEYGPSVFFRQGRPQYS